jgi:hypothetical protein
MESSQTIEFANVCQSLHIGINKFDILKGMHLHQLEKSYESAK